MPHAHASGFPSPALAHSNDRGGQAPALRKKITPPLHVGRWETLSLAMPRALQRSRGTGPRTTKKITPALTVGRGPVPRHASRTPTIAGDRPPRYEKNNAPLIVGRGPVPRQRSIAPTIAGETRSDARMASEGPRATIKITPAFHRRAVGNPVPRQCSRTPTIVADRPPRSGNIETRRSLLPGHRLY